MGLERESLIMRIAQKVLCLAVAAGLLAGAALAVESVPSAAPTAAPTAEPPKTAQEITPEQMKGVSFEGLTAAQKGLAFSIMSDNRCDCGCGMTIAACRVKDSTCGRSLGLATQVLDLAKRGKGKDEIVKAVLSPPSKYVQFDLPVGESAAVGPKDAKVTILYYLDHQ
jgi:hypothetical protein